MLHSLHSLHARAGTSTSELRNLLLLAVLPITYQEHSLILDAVTDVGAGAGEACGGCTAPSSAGACSGKLTGFGADADAGADCRTAITACGWRVAGTAETRGLGDTEA